MSMTVHHSQKREFPQGPGRKYFPVFGHHPTNGARYPFRMPKIGKAIEPSPELFETPPEDVVSIARDSLAACFAFAARTPGLRDRANANQLANHMARFSKHYGNTVSKSHIYRMENGQGPVGSDVLHMIAKAYGLQAWHMLVPGLEPANPPAVLVDDSQRAMYKAIQQSMRIIQNKEASDVEESPAGGTVKRSDSQGAPRSRGDAPRSPKAKAGRKPKAKA
jgi:hypothetical protein